MSEIIKIKATDEQLKQLQPIKDRLDNERGGVIAQCYLADNPLHFPIGTMRFMFIPLDHFADVKEAIENAIRKEKV